MTTRKQLFTAIFCVASSLLHAQDKLPVRFGKVTPEDFNVVVTGPDSAAGAVVIADFGTSTFEANSAGWFDLVFRHSCRIKILKQTAFEAGTITIPYYISGRESERISGMHASTYTLENGTVVETRLEDKNIFATKMR